MKTREDEQQKLSVLQEFKKKQKLREKCNKYSGSIHNTPTAVQDCWSPEINPGCVTMGWLCRKGRKHKPQPGGRKRCLIWDARKVSIAGPEPFKVSKMATLREWMD